MARKKPAKKSVHLEPRNELDAIVKDINKTHGDGVIAPASLVPSFRHIPTGIFTIDVALLGGMPEGLVTLIYGWESSGKSTLCYRSLAGAQKKYPRRKAALIDIEGTYDQIWGRLHGINNDDLLYVRPTSGEMALDIADGLIRTKQVSMVVVDSLAALLPMAEVDRSLEDVSVAERARIINRFAGKVYQAFHDERKRGHHPAILLVNQWRYKVGIIHGDNRTLPGGPAPNFLASVKIDVQNMEKIGQNERELNGVLYNEHGFRIKKNKVGPSIREGQFKMIRDPLHPLGAGFIDDGSTVVTWLKKLGFIERVAPPYEVSHPLCEGIKFKSQGAIAEWLYEDPARYEKIKTFLINNYRETMGLSPDYWLQLDDAYVEEINENS